MKLFFSVWRDVQPGGLFRCNEQKKIMDIKKPPGGEAVVLV
jgi:hypothetical protein